MSDDRNFASSSMKIPIFDGTDRTQYQAWADDFFDVSQYHDLDEYVESDWRGKYIPTKNWNGFYKVIEQERDEESDGYFRSGNERLAKHACERGRDSSQ